MAATPRSWFPPFLLIGCLLPGSHAFALEGFAGGVSGLVSPGGGSAYGGVIHTPYRAGASNGDGSSSSGSGEYMVNGDIIQLPLDANGDGDADFLMRDAATGAWLLQQTLHGSVIAANPVSLYASPDQQFIGSGDFNGDGTDDVMLRSASEGYYTVFLLQDYAVSSTVFYNAWTSAQSVPQGIDDFDGDGTDDLLVRRTSDNLYYVFKTANGAVDGHVCICDFTADQVIGQ